MGFVGEAEVKVRDDPQVMGQELAELVQAGTALPVDGSTMQARPHGGLDVLEVVELGDAPFDSGCSELLRRFFAEFEVALELLALVPGGLVEAVVEEADAAEDVLLALDGALASALEVALCEGVGKLVGLEGVGEAFAFGGELVGGELLELFVGGAFGGALAEDALEAVGEDVGFGSRSGSGSRSPGRCGSGLLRGGGRGPCSPTRGRGLRNRRSEVRILSGAGKVG